MNTHLRSDTISLQFGNDTGESGDIDELWQMLRRTAVEPGQSPSPDYASFSDDCLLCAHIITNEDVATQDEREHEIFLDPYAQEHAQGSPSHSSMTPTAPLPSPGQTVGLIYLHAGPANLPAGEANIGVITKPDMQHRGYAREAVQLVLRWAFEELKFHRVQAAILDTPFKDRALRLFIGSGFAHEGTKRRGVYQPEGEGIAGVWKDVTYLAMLDTKYMLKSKWMGANRVSQPPITSVWDEMFARHSREREELVWWEEKHGRLRRSSSMETLKEYSRNAAQNMAYLTDDASSLGGSSPPSPRPNAQVTWGEDAHMTNDLGRNVPHQRWEEVIETSIAARRNRQRMGNFLDPSLQGHTLTLPSIPSTRASEGSLQSPLTIASPSIAGSTPPYSPSPSPASSSVASTWTDAEDEDNWLPRENPFATPHDTYPLTRSANLGTRSRSSSVSSSSTDSWSDAQTSVSASSSTWDIVSNTSDHVLRGRD